MTVSETAGPGYLPGRRPSSTLEMVVRTRLRGAALLCAVLAPASPVSATTVADATLVTVVRDTLVVHGQAAANDVFPATSGVVTVVDLETTRGGADLAELLSRVAGLQVRRYGGIGAEAIPSIRGSTGAQVQVLIDGLPLADAQRGAVDISLLPLERYDRAEVHRGLVPAGFGGIGAAGAVNLLTRPDAAGPALRLFAGSFGDLGGRFSHGLEGGHGTRRGLLLIHGRRIDNRYEYLDHNQTFHDPEDDVVRTRENADFAQWGCLGQGEIEGDAGLARGTVGYFRRDGGRPGPLGFPSPNARVRHERLDGRIGVASPGGRVTLDLAAARQEDWLFDSEREVGLDPYDQTRAVGDDLLGRVAWTPRWDLGEGATVDIVCGGDARDQWYRQTNDGHDDPLRHRRTVSAFAGVALAWHGPRLTLHPSWRWQRFRDNFPPVPNLPWLPEEEGVVHEQDAVSPSLGASWQAVPDRLIFEAHWYRSVRQPTWIELFGQPGGLAGNRELVPEELTGRDVGLRWTPPSGAVVRVTAFEQQAEQTIIYYWAGLGVSRPANIGRSRTRGVELEGVLQRGPADLAANVTWQEARDDGGLDDTYQGKALPYLSDWEAYLDLRWRLGAWQPGVAVIYQSANYRTRYNREVDRAPARTLLNLVLRRTWDDGIWGRGRTATITGEILNLTDNDVYDVEGYPLPGRTVRLAFHWR